MILQKFALYPYSEETTQLYMKTTDNVVTDKEKVELKTLAKVNLETYFNLFSCLKWKKYVGVESVYLRLKLNGIVKVKIDHLQVKDGDVERHGVLDEEIQSDASGYVTSNEFTLPEKGMLGVIIEAVSESVLYEVDFSTDQTGMEENDICIGIGICTFKREKYVERNMNLLKEGILNNPAAEAYDHIKICISDNAGTLEPEKIENPEIHVVKNKNLGGVGGFTRTMLEYLNGEEKISHVLLMDDDAIILPETIERNYLFLKHLKKKYYNYVIGGALMRLDHPSIQYESGALWNNGDMIAHNHDFDMTSLAECITNEVEIEHDYVGWWYSCIPVTFINKNKLPLPLFIHRDDIEYGLRANGEFILLNGICVWHEAFENKCPGTNEYYDIRNLAILNAIHDEKFTAKQFKKVLFKEISSNIGKYRYKYVDLNLLGTLDFLKGAKWFSEQDGIEIHKKLAAYNYEMKSKEDFIGYKGLTEEDLSPYGKEQREHVPFIEKSWKMATMNGHFLPARHGKPKAEILYPNIYDLYRYKEVLYIDSTDHVLDAKRSVIAMIASYIKFFKVCKHIDQRYDKVCEQYRDMFGTFTSKDFWNHYLELDKNMDL